MNEIQLIHCFGWCGVLFFTVAYYLLSINYLSSKHYLFHLLNIIGAIGLTVNAFYYGDQPNLLVNIIWILIGVISIIRNAGMTNKQKSSDLEPK